MLRVQNYMLNSIVHHMAIERFKPLSTWVQLRICVAFVLALISLSCTGAPLGRDSQGSLGDVKQSLVAVHGRADVFVLDESRGTLLLTGSLQDGAEFEIIHTQAQLAGWLPIVNTSPQQIVLASQGNLEVLSSTSGKPVGQASLRSSSVLDFSAQRRLIPVGTSNTTVQVPVLLQHQQFSAIYVPETNHIGWITSHAVYNLVRNGSTAALAAVHISTVGTLTGSGVVAKKLLGGFTDLGIPSRLVLPTSPGEVGQQAVRDAAPLGVPVDSFVVEGGNPVWTTPLPGLRQRWGDLSEAQWTDFIVQLFATARQSVLSVAQTLSERGGGDIVTIVHHMGPNTTIAAMLYDDASLHAALPPNVRYTNVVIPVIHGTGALAFNPLSRDLHGGFNGEGWDRYREFVTRGIPSRISVAIASTEDMATQTSELFGLSPDRIRVVPLGAGEPFRPIPELHNIPENAQRRAQYLQAFNAQADEKGADAGIADFLPGDRMLLFVGKLVNKKGPTELIQILATIHQMQPDLRVHAAFIGSGELRDSLKGVAQSLGVREFVHVLGARDQVIITEFQNFTDLFVMPYVWQEPFGLVPFEAALCGTPTVIPSDAGAVSAVANAPWLFTTVDKRADGIIDIQKFAEAIIARLQADAKYSNVNGEPYWQVANRYILNSFGWDVHAEKVASIAREVLSQQN